MQQIIQLKPDDDIAAIRARLEAADLAHVVLVIPRDCVFLSSITGLSLLRRAADDMAMQIALVSHDESVTEHAEEYGLPVFGSIKQSQSARWRMTAPARATGMRTANLPPPAPPEFTFSMRAMRLFREWRLTLLLIAIALFFLGIAAFVLAPSAQVYIVPASVAMTANTDITIDSSVPDVRAEARVVPARRVIREISGTLSLRTTVTKTIPDARSTGTVVFSNLRTEETIVPPGAIVMTSAGVPIRFTTTTTATLPAGLNSRAEVSIQAVDPGPAGNVKELAINAVEGSLGISVRVINTKPTASGNLRPVKIVTENDKKKLEEQLTLQLKQQAPAVLQRALEAGEMIPPDSILIDVTNTVFDRSVDDPADVLNLKMTADAFGLGVDQSDLSAVARGLFQKQVQSGYQLLPSGAKLEMLPGGKYQGIQLRQPVRALGYATPQLDAAKVARAVQGKPVAEAKSYLFQAVSLAQQPDIRVAPPGWPLMPLLPFRIAVFIEPQTVGK